MAVWAVGPFGAGINVAAKCQCHARLGPLWCSPTAKANEDFRLKRVRALGFEKH